MKISTNWLEEYLHTGLSPEKIAERLTATGLEVEGMQHWQSVEGGLEGLLTAEVVSAVKHPNADKLTLTAVNTGSGELLQVVCGAPNVAAGQKVVFAPVGTTLYPKSGDPFKIKKAKIRGEASFGMICAEDEIGLGADHDGVMVLDPETTIGQPISGLFNVVEDDILDIGLTANRGDAFSHIGVARDLSASIAAQNPGGPSVQLPDLGKWSIDNRQFAVDVQIEAHGACSRYSGISLSDVKIGPSPEWMQIRLRSIGLKPINNVVDITNFVLHETGHPLHAFDLDKIKDRKVIVKMMEEGTAFTTLDGDERKLTNRDLLICDTERPLCLAGIYGGQNSGVTDTTQNIFLECAQFDYLHIRRSSSYHNLRTDAAQHFEKGTDINNTVDVLKRAALLLREYAGAKISSDIVDVYPEPIESFPVSLRLSRLALLTGIQIERGKVKAILEGLGIGIVSESEDKLELAVPTAKTDVLREIDVIEEIIRIYGLDNIPMPGFVRCNVNEIEHPDNEMLRNRISDFLSAKGFCELFTNAITKSAGIEKYMPEYSDHCIPLLNSLNADLDMLRPSMMPGGLEVLRHNSNRQQNDLLFYEFGKIFQLKQGDSAYFENEVLSIFMSGRREEENWIRNTGKLDFFDLKQLVFSIFERLGIYRTKVEVASHPMLGQAIKISSGKVDLGILGEINKEICADFDLKEQVWYAALNWDSARQLLKKKKTEFNELPKYPSVRRDLSIILGVKYSYAEVEEIARKLGGGLLKDTWLFDKYEGDKLESDQQSLGIALLFQDQKKTLKDRDIDKIMQRMIDSYEKNLNAIIRR